MCKYQGLLLFSELLCDFVLKGKGINGGNPLHLELPSNGIKAKCVEIIQRGSSSKIKRERKERSGAGGHA